MNEGRILELMRPLVLVVDGLGTVVVVRGGAGGFLGYDTSELAGQNVLDFVWPTEVEAVARLFADQVGGPIATASFPMSFRVSLIGSDGAPHPVDVIATGLTDEPDAWGWVVVLVPVAMAASSSLALDAEIEGASRGDVKRLLADELAEESGRQVTRWALVDFISGPQPVITPSTLLPPGLRAALGAEIAAGWCPWAHSHSAPPRSFVGRIEVPAVLRHEMRRHGWERATMATVETAAGVVGCYLSFGTADPDELRGVVRTNADLRLERLRRVTSMLFSRWLESDRIVEAATTDPLTGLLNRRALDDELADRGEVSVLYVDIDDFKAVNDTYGHAVGDEVLRVVARRIAESCRDGDVVTRMGGDEFVVLVDRIDPTRAAAVGDRIVRRVAAPLGIPGGPHSVSVSVGMATHCGSGEGSAIERLECVARADMAMLAAKRAGRGRLVSA